MITVDAKLGYSVVDFAKDNENYLLLTLTGKKLETQIQRPPISVVGLLDLSSSMRPEYKIGYLKKSVVKMIENLKDTDRMSLIGYSTNAWSLLPLTEMTAANKKKAIDIVNGLSIYNMTNISEALTLGFHEFKDKLQDEGINRVILFTDGCPTSGNCQPNDLINLAANVPAGVQVTTMGYGKASEPNGISIFNGMGGELNTTLLEKMAEAGKGNYYYMSDPDSCGRAFANELAGLLTVVGQNVKITVTPKNHMKIVEVMDDVDVEDVDGSAVITIPDIISEESKYILIKVKTSKVDKVWARAASIADVSVTYSNVIKGSVDIEKASAKITFAKKGFTKDMDADVKTQLEVINAIKTQEQAFAMAQAGDYVGASNLMDVAINNLSSTGTARGASYLSGLNITKSFVADNATYTASVNMRSAGLNAMKNSRASGSVYDTVYTTSCQNNMQDSFVDGKSADVTSGDAPTGSSITITPNLGSVSSVVINSDVPKAQDLKVAAPPTETSYTKKSKNQRW